MKYKGIQFDRRDALTYVREEIMDWVDRMRYRCRTAVGRGLNRMIDRAMSWWITMMADPVDD